jgi:hypothetical protein
MTETPGHSLGQQARDGTKTQKSGQAPTKAQVKSFYHPCHGAKSRETFRLFKFQQMLDSKFHTLKIRELFSNSSIQWVLSHRSVHEHGGKVLTVSGPSEGSTTHSRPRARTSEPT